MFNNLSNYLAPKVRSSPMASISKYLWNTIQGTTPAMQKLQSYQVEPTPPTPIQQYVASAVSPLEVLADYLVSKERGGIGEAIKRGGDIPGALMSRGVTQDYALPLGMFAAMVLPGAGELNQMTKRPTQPKGVGGVDISNISKQDLSVYGKDIANVGRSYFGEPTTQLGKNIVSKIDSRIYDQVGVLAQASKNIKVRRDARMFNYILSDQVSDANKLDSLLNLQKNLESVGTPEGNIINNAINQITKGFMK